MIGRKLGPYEVLAKLGAGGMGEVYRARDTRLGRDVAIKVLPDAVAATPERRRRFEQEARAVAALNHPHICQIYDVGPSYLVLEYVDGVPIAGPMTAETAGRMALQIAGAVEAAHARGLLHRDLKPANILMTSAGDTKLLDFGVVKLLQHDTVDDVTQTMEGTAVGTAPYMSPEQVEGKIVDARSDIFSFGAVLYELLSGTRAFGGNTTAQVLSAVLRDTPRPIAASPLARIAGRCLEKDPVRRYQTMGEVRAALENVVRERSDSEASVAVLPFADLSPGKDQEWFSDGLAEEIINALTRIPDLKVIARTSAFAFKGKNEDVRRIGDALGVSTILEGSVRQAGQRIRVTAQLVRAADGSHVWSERYDRDLADVFAVQDEIATAITSALQVKLAGTLVPGRRHTPNLTAYDHYLKGIYDAGQWTPESMARARTHFERALDLDPQFAVAHAEYAHLFFRFAINGIMPPREALPLVRREARRALAIDPSLPEGHAMLGAVAAMFDYDWEEAEQQFRLALATTATPAYVHRWFAHFYLLPLGRCDEAVEHHTIGLKDDPINTTARSERAVCLDAAGRHAEAVAELRAVIELAESYWFPYFILGCRHMLDGDLHDALGPAERCYRLAPWFLPGVGLLAALFERLGETQRASTLVPQLSSDDSYAEPLGLGMYHLLRGDLDQAAAFAEKAIDHRQPAAFFFLRVHASALRSSRHWTRLAGMTNLPL